LAVQNELDSLKSDPDIKSWLEHSILAPIGQQELWAAGVTYLRSRDARINESKESGGATFYDKVYNAERPELFFKATAQRVVGNNEDVRIRKDSIWNIPEPELTLMITSGGEIVGYTIGNDMSSRSIEGENPLYLPQAKIYDGSASLGPCIYISEHPIPLDTEIHIQIERGSNMMYSGSTSISQMKRTHKELVQYLYRECSFSNGCFLMTGTCLVPPNEFTLLTGDKITMKIDHIGTLINKVA
jgi:2-dehydro-3-deoxy-D-arabinonate dehydratase